MGASSCDVQDRGYNMNLQIATAIQKRQLLSFTYNDELRVVQPHAFGKSRKGDDLLRAYSPTDAAWKLFTVSKIEGLATEGDTFYNAPGYKRNDSAMASIYVQVS